MKKIFRAMLAVVVTCATGMLYGAGVAETPAAKEIEATIRQYFVSMGTRNSEKLSATLDKQLMAIEAGRENARVHMLETIVPSALLPPEGNDDWRNVRISAVKVEVSSTHPTVATVAFTVTYPFDDKKVAAMKAALKERSEAFNETERRAMEKLIIDRAAHTSMLAMLARLDTRWKIVCISFPN